MSKFSPNGRSLSRRQFLGLSTSAVVGSLMAGKVPGTAWSPPFRPLPQSGPSEQDILGMPNAATGVPYQVKSSINNGEPITLTYWEWASDRAVYEQEWIKEYM